MYSMSLLEMTSMFLCLKLELLCYLYFYRTSRLISCNYGYDSFILPAPLMRVSYSYIRNSSKEIYGLKTKGIFKENLIVDFSVSENLAKINTIVLLSAPRIILYDVRQDVDEFKKVMKIVLAISSICDRKDLANVTINFECIFSCSLSGQC